MSLAMFVSFLSRRTCPPLTGRSTRSRSYAFPLGRADALSPTINAEFRASYNVFRGVDGGVAP